MTLTLDLTRAVQSIERFCRENPNIIKLHDSYEVIEPNRAVERAAQALCSNLEYVNNYFDTLVNDHEEYIDAQFTYYTKVKSPDGKNIRMETTLQLIQTAHNTKITLSAINLVGDARLHGEVRSGSVITNLAELDCPVFANFLVAKMAR